MDVLTGDHTVLRADLLHDVGRSLNPAIDVGQVEGAFVQGLGLLTLEETVWFAQSLGWGPNDGSMFTKGPSTYKVRPGTYFPVAAELTIMVLDSFIQRHSVRV